MRWQLGSSALYLGLLVVVPLIALVVSGANESWSAFWNAVSAPQARSAYELTFGISAVVAVVNAFVGTAVAWTLVRDSFPGLGILDTLIDLPFALPTVVAGLTLTALYGPKHPLGFDLSYSRWGVLIALLFVTMPFVVRAVQPVLMEFDRDMEHAAASLGASPFVTFRRVMLPNLAPAIISGCALSFARAVGEYGSVVLISGNRPFHTEVASVYVAGQQEAGNTHAAAAVSVVLLLATVIVLVLLGFFQARQGRRV